MISAQVLVLGFSQYRLRNGFRFCQSHEIEMSMSNNNQLPREFASANDSIFELYH
jgi:hypothetical protein